MRPVVIRRKKKEEAEQAIRDLEKKGFEVIFPLTQFTKDGKRFTTDNYNRIIFLENTFTTVWVAKMRRVAK